MARRGRLRVGHRFRRALLRDVRLTRKFMGYLPNPAVDPTRRQPQAFAGITGQHQAPYMIELIKYLLFSTEY